MVSLRSHTCGGYSNKRYTWLKKELLQTYGYEHMLSLPRLESVGLLREKDGKDAWPTLKRAFRLLVPVRMLQLTYILVLLFAVICARWLIPDYRALIDDFRR